MMSRSFHGWRIVFVLTHPAVKIPAPSSSTAPHGPELHWYFLSNSTTNLTPSRPSAPQTCVTKGGFTDPLTSLSVATHLFVMQWECVSGYGCGCVCTCTKAPCETWIFICETAWNTPSTCFHTHLAVGASPSRVARWQHGLTMHVVRFHLHNGDTNTLGDRTHQETAATRQNEAHGTAWEGKAEQPDGAGFHTGTSAPSSLTSDRDREAAWRQISREQPWEHRPEDSPWWQSCADKDQLSVETYCNRINLLF